MEIRVKNITKQFKGIECISNVSFACYAGEITGVLAPHGSGKSLLLNLVRKNLAPDVGSVCFEVEGKDLSLKELPRHLGYLSADNPLYNDMTVYDSLSFVASLYKMPRYLRKDRVRNLIKTCGLSRNKHRYVKELSKGQKQRLGIAQTLVHNPPFLLLDEPVTGLDPIQSEQLYDLIKEQGRERAVLITSSRMRDMEAMCDTMLVLSSGRVLAKGTVDSLKKEVANSSILKVKIGGATDGREVYPLLQALDYIQVVSSRNLSFDIHTTQEERFSQDLFKICCKNGWYIMRLVAAEKSLEDIFKQLKKY